MFAFAISVFQLMSIASSNTAVIIPVDTSHISHVIEYLFFRRAPGSFAFPKGNNMTRRHFCPVSISARIAGVQLVDQFLWSALMLPESMYLSAEHYTVADALGYGNYHLKALCNSILVDHTVPPTPDNVSALYVTVCQQLEFSRTATLVPEEISLIEKGKHRKFPVTTTVSLTYEPLQYISEKFQFNAWSPDSTVHDYVCNLVDYEVPIKPTNTHARNQAILSLEFQLLSILIAHRQKFLDANPHIATAIQRIFKKPEPRPVEVKSNQVLEKLQRLEKMRLGRKCFQQQPPLTIQEQLTAAKLTASASSSSGIRNNAKQAMSQQQHQQQRQQHEHEHDESHQMNPKRSRSEEEPSSPPSLIGDDEEDEDRRQSQGSEERRGDDQTRDDTDSDETDDEEYEEEEEEEESQDNDDDIQEEEEES